MLFKSIPHIVAVELHHISSWRPLDSLQTGASDEDSEESDSESQPATNESLLREQKWRIVGRGWLVAKRFPKRVLEAYDMEVEVKMRMDSCSIPSSVLAS